jgi:hypothetical protein
MHRRALLALALVAAACSPAVDSTDNDLAPSSSTTTPASPTAISLSYLYEPGTTLTYDLVVSQDIAFDADGGAEGFGEVEFPIDADLTTQSAGTAVYTIGDAPGNGTVSLTITAAMHSTEASGTLNDDEVTSIDEGGIAADLARINPVNVELTFSRLGRVMRGDEIDPQVLGASLASLTGLADDLLAQPIGPVFVEDPVAVGDSWEVSEERQGPNGPLPAHSVSTVEEVVDGRYVIRTTTIADGYVVDFSEQFRQLFLGFSDLEEGVEIPAEVQEQLESIEFSITVAESVTTEVVEFDPETGLVVSSIRTSELQLTMVFRSPDETTGDLNGFDIRLDLSQTARFTLAS